MAVVPGAATVGRAAELSAAAGFLDAVPAGPGAFVLEGEAGIGKTTIWRGIVAAAADRGYQVISATAVGQEADLPFVVLRDLLDPLPPDTAVRLPATRKDRR